MQQHVSGPRRARTEKRADDPARRFRRLQRPGLEPLVEIIRGAHREQFLQRVKALGTETAKKRGELRQRREVAGRARRGIRRCHRKQRLHRTRHLVHEPPEFVVRLGVARRMPGELAAILVVVAPLPEVVTVRQRRDRAFERQDMEAMNVSAR